LRRPKWERIKYRDSTIDAALEGLNEFYEAGSSTSNANGSQPSGGLFEDFGPGDTDAPEARASSDEQEPVEQNTWRPVDLTAALTKADIEPPTMWERSDGTRFIYPARVHWFQGESESLKSWAAQIVVAEQLGAGNHVLYIDLEDDDRSVVSRLGVLGVSADDIGGFLTYVRPDEPMRAQDLDALLALDSYVLAVIDGVTEAMTLDQLKYADNSDIATWLRALPKKVARSGAATICIDHVTKAPETQGRYAIGGQHKLAGTTGAAYKFTLLRPLSRPQGIEPVLGLAEVTVVKDRPGYVRKHALDDKIGTIQIEAYADGTVSAGLVPPGTKERTPDAHLVTRILEFLAVYDGSSKNRIENEVEGKAASKREALLWMASDERAWICIKQSGQSHRHFLTAAGRAELKRRSR
jgi:hypothetical protein